MLETPGAFSARLSKNCHTANRHIIGTPLTQFPHQAAFRSSRFDTILHRKISQLHKQSHSYKLEEVRASDVGLNGIRRCSQNTTNRTDHSISSTSRSYDIFAVLGCCARSVTYIYHPANVCARFVFVQIPSSNYGLRYAVQIIHIRDVHAKYIRILRVFLYISAPKDLPVDHETGI